MSRRSSNNHGLRSSYNTDLTGSATGVSTLAEPTIEPSLESLLASCEALQSVLRPDDEGNLSDETDKCRNPGAEGDTFSAQPSSRKSRDCGSIFLHEDISEQQLTESPDATGSDTALPTDVAILMDALRREFRASIDELKSAQAAAAESQSAVLKTLTEIIFQSSSMRDDSGSGLEKKLAEFEDRILHRITQVSRVKHVGEPKETGAPLCAGSNATTPVKNDSSRSWAEIRNQFMAEDEIGTTSGEPSPPDIDRIREESAGKDKVMSVPDYILDVPSAIDPETLTEEELRAAFFERESFIATLIGRMRHLHQRSSGHLPAEQLMNMAEHLPEDLAAKVLHTLKQLDEIARVGELELSLERARLARQVNQVNLSRQLIAHNARQLGLTIEEDGTLSNPQTPSQRRGSSSSRRWLSKLGFGQ